MNITEIIEQTLTLGPADIVPLAGLIVLAAWLIRTSFGTKALSNSMPRANDMAAYTPFIPMTVWLGTFLLMSTISAKVLSGIPEWQNALVDNIIMCLSATAGAVVVISIARVHFAAGIKGLGLNPRTIFKDFAAAVLNLLGVQPVVLLMIVITIFVGRIIYGAEFGIEKHQELEMLTEHSQLSVKILISLTAIVVMPIFEEMLFRGLFQTMLRSFTNRPWAAIMIASALFATIHSNSGHWPALFALAVCIGYAYEKSGSLLRAIFIHMLFNAISIIGTLFQ